MDEDKYTKFPNELLEAIMSYRFSPTQMAVLLYIVRKTYGWGKHEDQISISKMATSIGRYRSTTMAAVSDLAKLNVIEIEKEGSGRPNTMRILDPKDWDRPVLETGHVLKSGHVLKTGQVGVRKSGQGGVLKNGQVPVRKSGHTKEKKEINKEIYKESQNPKKKGWGDFEEHNYNWDMIESLLGRKIREEN